MLKYVGFAEIDQILPYPDSYAQYTSQDRIVLLAK